MNSFYSFEEKQQPAVSFTNDWSSPFKTCELRLPVGAGQHNSIGADETLFPGYLKCGVDLVCNPNTPVYALEDGFVISTETFYNNKTKPWISSSKALFVSSQFGSVVYGNIQPLEHLLAVGTAVKKGDQIGVVSPFYSKESKSTTGDNRLRIELYRKGTNRRPRWKKGNPIPKNILNPTPLLLPLIVTSVSLRRRKQSF